MHGVMEIVALRLDAFQPTSLLTKTQIGQNETWHVGVMEQWTISG